MEKEKTGKKRKGFLKWISFILAATLLVTTFSVTASAAAQLDGGTVEMTGWVTNKNESYIWGENSYFAGSNEAPITSVDYVKTGSAFVISKNENFDGKVTCYIWAHMFDDNIINGCAFVGTLSSENFVPTGYVDDGIVSGKPAKVEFKDYPDKKMNFMYKNCIYQFSIIFEPKDKAPYSYTYYFKVMDENQVAEQTQPTETTQPEQTTAPAETTQPEQTTTPTETTQPEQTTAPTETTQPEQTTVPTETTQPEQTTVPTETTQPEQTTVPTETTQPEQTTAPAETTQPTEQVKPKQPTTQTKQTETPAKKMLEIHPANGVVWVNGLEVEFEAYEINHSNYLKLRDLAMALSGTNKSFDIRWDAQKDIIYISSQTPYVRKGGELETKTNAAGKKAILSTTRLFVDGKEIQLTAYDIQNNNFYKLRDLAKALNFDVKWDGASGIIHIFTASDYTE